MHENRTARDTILCVLVTVCVLALLGCGGGGGGSGSNDNTSSGTGGSSAAGTGVGSIVGKVVDYATSAGIAGVTVNTGDLSTTTDSSGKYTLASVPVGTRLVVATKTNVGSQSSVVFLTAGQVATVNLILGATSGGGSSGGTSSQSGPRISYSNPSNGAANVDPATQIIFQFDQSVQESTLSTNLGGSGIASVVFSRITTPSQDDSGVATIARFGSLTNGYVYQPGVLSKLVSGATYGLFVTNRVLGANGKASPGSSFSFTVRSASGGGSSAGPKLVYRNPPDGSIGVDPSSRILFAFDQEVDDLSVTTSGHVLFSQLTAPSFNDGQAKVQRATDLSGLTNAYELIPSIALSTTTTYAVFVTNRVVSAKQVPSPGESFSFTTREQNPESPPVIVSSNPANATTNIDPQTQIFITLSSNVDSATVTTASVKLMQISTPVQAVAGYGVECSNNPTCTVWRVTHPALDGGKSYQVSINNRVQSRGGVRSLGSSIWFQTQPAQGSLAPQVIYTNPANGSINVDTGSRIFFTFNKPVVAADVTSNVTPAVLLVQVSGITSSDRNPTITPIDLSGTGATQFEYRPGTLSLSPGQTFRVNFNNNIRDLAGHRLNPTYIEFSTANVQDIPQGPRIISANPTANQTGVDPSSSIIFTFDKDVYPNKTDAWQFNTLNPDNVFLTRVTAPAGKDLRMTLATPLTLPVYNNGVPSSTFTTSILPVIYRPDPGGFSRTFRYIPGTQPLQEGLIRYTLYVTNGVHDSLGNAAQGDAVSFTTRDSATSLGEGPRLISSNPTNGSFTAGGMSCDIYLMFDKPIDASSLPPIATSCPISVSTIAIPVTDCVTPPLLVCDLRTEDVIQCTCSNEQPITACQPYGAYGIKVTANLTGGHTTVYIKVTNKLTSGGKPAAGDTMYYFLR